MSRFPARHEVPEFTVFASLLRMTTKYGFSDVRNQLVKDVKGAYPTKWEVYQAAEVLGEDVFGSPKPHPNAVLNLFKEQNIKFALPFAAYRASIGGFSALMSDIPDTVLPRRTLATTTRGMFLVRNFMSRAARVIAYEENLGVCADRTCTLSVGINLVGQRAEVLKRLYHVMILFEWDGGGLGPLTSKCFACAKCTREIRALHATWRSKCWEQLPGMFLVVLSWDKVEG
jgi:hypothetical protein